MNIVGELWILKCQNGFYVQDEVVIVLCSSVPLSCPLTEEGHYPTEIHHENENMADSLNPLI